MRGCGRKKGGRKCLKLINQEIAMKAYCFKKGDAITPTRRV